MNAMLQSFIRPAFGLLLVSSVATGAVVTSARPAQAGVAISVGVGFGGYAPVYYRPYRRVYYGYGRFGPPRFIYRRPAYFYRGPFGRPYYYSRFYHGYGYGRGYGYGYRRGYGYR